MPFLTLFARLFLRPFAREPLRTALSILAVALGVAVVIAIELAGQAAAGSFRSSLATLAGKADFELTAVGGIDEMLLVKLATAPYPLQLHPRLEDFAEVQPSGLSVPLIGLDLVANATLEASSSTPQPGQLNRSNPIWVSRGLAKADGNLTLLINDQRRTFTVAAELPAQERFVLLDIATAQEVLGRLGRLDRIEVSVPTSPPLPYWQKLLQDQLPPSVLVRPFGAQTDENRRMLAAFRWNLRILSYIALVVGAFLIYNTISVSVVRRRVEIGIVRAIGATRGMVLAAFLAEGAFFGVLGSALGLLLGRVLASGAVRLLAATVDALYVSSTPGEISLSPAVTLWAFVIGIVVTLLAAFAPAREASQVAPVEAMARGRRDYESRIHTRRNLAVAGLLLLAAYAASRLSPVGGKPLFGYAAAALLIAAGACAIPATVAAVSRLLRPAVQRGIGVTAALAFRSLSASLGRTSVLVGALSTAVAMMVSVGLMVGSFRQTVLLWMDAQLQADFYLRPAGPAAADRHPTLGADLADAIERLPGVANVDRLRVYPISYEGMPASLGGAETQVLEQFRRTAFLPGADRATVLRELPRGNNVVVSEPFANKHNVKFGDFIRLPLGTQEQSFRVLAIYYDYSSESGYILMDRAILLKYLPDPALSNLAVYVQPNANWEQTRREIERLSARRHVLLFTNRTLRTEAVRIFDRTFAITYALEIVALIVAVLGVAGALLALIIDRRREFGLLRFLGASTLQVRRLILCEAGILGLLANGIGFTLGYLLSLVLIYVINKQSFGWTIQFHWPVSLLISALTLIYLATLAAALYPARTAAQLNPIEVIHED